VWGGDLISTTLLAWACTARSSLGAKQLLALFTCASGMSLSPPSTFLCVTGSCTVVDKNAHTIGAIHLYTAQYNAAQIKIVIIAARLHFLAKHLITCLFDP
jgi:hypothetical protein